MAFPSSNGDDVDEFTRPQTKYVPLQELYKTAPVVQSGEPSVVSKTGKVRRRTNSDHQDDRERSSDEIGVSNVRNTYSRSRRRKKPSVFGNLRKQSGDEKVEAEEGEGEGWRRSKRRKVARRDGMDLGDDDSTGVGGIREGRSNRNRSKSKDVGDDEIKTSHQELRSKRKKSKGSVGSAKEWTRLIIDGDAKKFIGFKCKVYWPLDDTWYCGHIVGYNPETDRHHVKYLDGDEEHLILSKQRISFFVSPEEIQFLGLSAGVQCSDTDSIDKEVVDLAATLVDSADHFVPGDILWEAINGNATRPAIVVDESASFNLKGLNKISGEKTVLVQFFGTYEFARLREEQTVPFFKGCLQQRFKCEKSDFVRSLEEAKTYISNQKLPKAMLSVRKRNTSKSATANGEQEGSDEGTRAKEIRKSLDGRRNCPLEIGDLQIISLGKIAGDSNCFVDCNYICPEGYTAVRKFPSIADPSKRISYKMEVLRDEGNALNKPIFRVTSEKGEQFEGPDSSSCWDKIYRKVRKMQRFSSDAPKSYGPPKNINISGPGMFGFSHPEILKLIQPSELSMLTSKRYQDLPVGYRPVHITWKDLDKCNVCHMEEEYENNLLLQCDNCRMMVHSRCYGEQEPVDGVLWYCNLCRSGAPEYPTPCCLCPCIGGAMKPTTDGRWAHLACAIWIPETSLVDVKRMEPIDGVNRINKCANSSCYVAYHPLCARVAGFCLELEGEDRLHLIPGDKDEYNQNIQLLSFCKRHRPLSNQLIGVKDHIGQSDHHQLDYIPPPNPSGCARTESYNYLTRRGRKEPEAHGLSLKRLYVENRPYLVGGYTQHDSFSNVLSSKDDTSRDIFSMAEKYNHMSRTFRKRLAFGKSRIHGYGVFAKKTHLAGDMVIEYTGEVVRAPIADRREHLIYNSFVGAGTYMFRIDDERVIDATKAGSIAHLINHSCEPNCYSRVITITGDEHIIIFAKRDIQQWEELTYDYRFFSIDEQLACYCGFPTCRGVVNDIGPHEPIAKLCVPRSDLTVESDSGDENEW